MQHFIDPLSMNFGATVTEAVAQQRDGSRHSVDIGGKRPLSGLQSNPALYNIPYNLQSIAQYWGQYSINASIRRDNNVCACFLSWSLFKHSHFLKNSD